jgi:hypothetical protein
MNSALAGVFKNGSVKFFILLIIRYILSISID